MVVLEGTMYKELLYRENMMKPATRDATQLPSNFRGQRKEMSFSGLLWSRNDHRKGKFSCLVRPRVKGLHTG